jgi:hypothetical protein
MSQDAINEISQKCVEEQQPKIKETKVKAQTFIFHYIFDLFLLRPHSFHPLFSHARFNRVKKTQKKNRFSENLKEGVRRREKLENTRLDEE